MSREGKAEKRTTITMTQATKDRFLEFVGAPKKYESADKALSVLLDAFEARDKKVLEEMVNGVHSG